MKEIPLSKKFPHGIDITAPGGIAALMDFHRATFGDAVMQDAPPAPAEPLIPPVPAQPPAVPAPADDPAAQLAAERQARASVEADLAAARKLIQEAADAQLSDIDKAKKEAADAATENARLVGENARLTALAEHPVPAEYQHLVTGTDAASYAASAKAISELAAKAAGKPEPVPGSGRRDSDHDSAVGSMAAGAALYEAQKNKH